MNNSISNNILPQNHEMWKTHLIIGYYIILGIIQTLWLNPTVFPPMALRLSMIALTVAPLFFKKEFVPFVYIFFITLRLYLSTDYSYLPDIYSVKLNINGKWKYILVDKYFPYIDDNGNERECL